jgi:DNA-binding transcriptional ArsR family regulator
MLNDGLIELAAHRFALLADPTRLRILRALVDSGELNVGALAEAAQTSHFNTSQHLSRLAAAGLVARRREGSSAFYRSIDPTLPVLCELVCGSLRDQAAAIASGD